MTHNSIRRTESSPAPALEVGAFKTTKHIELSVTVITGVSCGHRSPEEGPHGDPAVSTFHSHCPSDHGLVVSLTGAVSAGQLQERRDAALVQGTPRGQAPGAPQAAPKEYPKLPEENVSATSHVMTLGGKPLAYTAVAGTLLLKADDGRPRANVYFTAYFRDDVKDKVQRPLTFVFNGGPGSSSVWLHLGAVRPEGRVGRRRERPARRPAASSTTSTRCST